MATTAVGRVTRPATGRKKESRREAILRAALRCFTAHGFAKTTMEDIRRRADASTGSLYHHFKSKEQLAAELYVEGVRNYQLGLVAELERYRTAESGIRAVVRYHLGWIDRHPAWARYLLQSREADFVTATKPVLRRLNQEMVERFAGWVEPFVTAGEVARLPKELYVALLVGPAQNYARACFAGRAETDPKTATQFLAEAAWQAVRAHGGPKHAE